MKEDRKLLQIGQNSENTTINSPKFHSRVVIPNGQPFSPEFAIKPAYPQLAPLQSIQYAQMAPYVNTCSKFFQPVSQTKTGINYEPIKQNKPVTEDAMIIYKGPLKQINPQMTPIEQVDNQIEKDAIEYYKKQNEFNKELLDIIEKNKKSKAKTLLTDFVKFLGVVAVGMGLYKFRHKIPFVKKLFA